MKRLIGGILVCVFLATICGCSVFSSKSKDTGKKKEREVKILGLPIVHTKEKVEE